MNATAQAALLLARAAIPVENRDAADWVSTVLLWILIAAGIALILVAIRLALAKTKAVEGSGRLRPQPLAVSVSANSGGGTRNASPVPPEDPHSPPTPSVGSPRVRV